MKQSPVEKDIFSHLEYAILLVNPKDEIVFCNDSVSQLWERDLKKILGRQFASLLPEEKLIHDHLRDVLRYGKNFTITGYQLKLSKELKKIVNITLNPVFGEDQKITEVALTFHDLTNHFRMKAKEQEEAILDSIGAFVSSVAHEIQNPLSGIKGVTQLLQRELKKANLPITSTDMILKELGRIDRLVKELLLHSHPIPLEYHTFNLHQLLDTVIWFEENSKHPNIHFVRQFDPSLPDITADRDKLHQVFLNLIKNAVEASEENATIVIRTNFCPQWEISGKKLDTQQEYYLIEFEDRGNGVEEDAIEQLFKPLFTTKPKGHGLGLSISFRIIAEHGGLLQYKPAEPHGSIFQVYIPRNSSNRKYG